MATAKSEHKEDGVPVVLASVEYPSETVPAAPPANERERAHAEREAKAAADQAALDMARGYRLVEWKPGVMVWQHIETQHTTSGPDGENEMRRYMTELAANAYGATPRLV